MNTIIWCVSISLEKESSNYLHKHLNKKFIFYWFWQRAALTGGGKRRPLMEEQQGSRQSRGSVRRSPGLWWKTLTLAPALCPLCLPWGTSCGRVRSSGPAWPRTLPQGSPIPRGVLLNHQDDSGSWHPVPWRYDTPLTPEHLSPSPHLTRPQDGCWWHSGQGFICKHPSKGLDRALAHLGRGKRFLHWFLLFIFFTSLQGAIIKRAIPVTLTKL